MPANSMPLREVRSLAEAVAVEMNYRLVAVELVREPTGRYLRFTIDREGGITLNELESYHRRVMPLVERVDYDFMEVTSPGADRPLQSQEDYDRAAGTAVEVHTYRAIDGAQRFVGDLIGLQGEEIVLDMGDAGERRFAKKDVATVRPWIEVDEKELEEALGDGDSEEK